MYALLETDAGLEGLTPDPDAGRMVDVVDSMIGGQQVRVLKTALAKKTCTFGVEAIVDNAPTLLMPPQPVQWTLSLSVPGVYR